MTRKCPSGVIRAGLWISQSWFESRSGGSLAVVSRQWAAERVMPSAPESAASALAGGGSWRIPDEVSDGAGEVSGLATPTEQIFVPAVVLGELYFGVLKSQRQEANLSRVEEFTTASNVLPVDAGVARHYGEPRNGLRRIGRPIPENDIWIAATAL